MSSKRLLAHRSSRSRDFKAEWPSPEGPFFAASYVTTLGLLGSPQLRVLRRRQIQPQVTAADREPVLERPPSYQSNAGYPFTMGTGAYINASPGATGRALCWALSILLVTLRNAPSGIPSGIRQTSRRRHHLMSGLKAGLLRFGILMEILTAFADQGVCKQYRP